MPLFNCSVVSLFDINVFLCVLWIHVVGIFYYHSLKIHCWPMAWLSLIFHSF